MRIKVGLVGLNALELIVKAVFILGKMAANPHYVTPLPTLASIQAKVDEMVDALSAAEGGDHDAVAYKNTIFKQLKLMLIQLAAYVQSTSNGDGDIIITSGYEVIVKGGPVGPMEKVSGMVANPNDFIGQLEANWNVVDGKDLYVIEKTTGDPTNEQLWTFAGYSTKTKFTVANLTTGQVYWLRVSAVGAAGKGPASDPARGVPS